MKREELNKLIMQACKRTWNEKICKEIEQALSQEQCADTVSIRKDILKCRVGNIVAYNVEWLKKHWQMEMDIVCGVKPCEDAISREDVMDWLENATYEDVCEAVGTTLDFLPSVTPSRHKGMWIKKDYWKPLPFDAGPLDWDNYDEKMHSEKISLWYCSECDAVKGEIQPTAKFCENCGVEMIEPQERSEENGSD